VVIVAMLYLESSALESSALVNVCRSGTDQL